MNSSPANNQDSEIDQPSSQAPPREREPVDLFKWLYNHNPFYVISAVLMLYAVRSSFGTLEIGSINCWVMMGVLGSYTIGLSLIGVLIVRWGKVWEDARSILLLLLLLFLGVSVSADDLFVKMESALGGAMLACGGFLGSVLLTEFTLRGIGLRMGWLYRLPLYLFLALFYATPWWLSPELHPRTATELDWTLFTFPVIGAGLLLTLLPAVRLGPRYINDNGSPWRWPLYPWTAFGMITIALALRTFAVCMTFGQTGPIWINASSGQRMIAFDTMWGIYFLVPIALAVLILMLEASLVTHNRKLTHRILCGLPILVLMAFPYSHGTVFRGFYQQVTTTVCSPIWLTLLMVLLVYTVTWLRGVRESLAGAVVSLLALSVVGPRTLGFDTLTAPQLLPIAAAGTLLLMVGLLQKSSWLVCVGAAFGTLALGIGLQETPLAGWKMNISFLALWVSLTTIAFTFHDTFAHLLRNVTATMLFAVGLLAMASPQAVELSWGHRVLLVVLLTGIGIGIGFLARHRWYLFAAFGLLALTSYEVAAIGFHSAKHAFGTATMTALLWSGGTLLIGVLISSHKAKWLPHHILPKWVREHDTH